MTSYEKVISFFKEICAIPHGTYHIDEISDYLVSFAKSRNLKFRQDELKNVIIWKNASAGYEAEPVMILQGHMDMVAVCDNPAEKDLLKEGLDLEEEDGYLFAKGTSLGADDGIAIAYALTILDSEEILHPALEVIFTVNEETGMNGALGIDVSDLTGKRFLNIDSEDEGIITVSCAGGVRFHGEFTGRKETVLAHRVFLSLSGLKGGHSGTDIHLGRANGAHLMAEILKRIAEVYDLRLISMSAGEKDNAIPSFGSADFLITDLSDPDEFMSDVEQLERELQEEYAPTDDDVRLVVGIQLPEETVAYTEDSSMNFLEYLEEVPDGVVSVCDDIDMVQTSLNLGILSCTGEKMTADFALRSSVANEKEELKERMIQITETYGGTWETFGEYPGWEYLEDSFFRKKAVAIYEKMTGTEAAVEGVHAGLECGIFADKIKGLDAISIGPDILNAHTTGEKLDLESAKRTWEFILELLSVKDGEI